MAHPHPLSGHLWSAALLAAAAALALAAERLSSAPVVPSGGAGALGDVRAFLAPDVADVAAAPSEIRVPVDPFGRGEMPVARGVRTPTVKPSGRTRQLTAILITDDTPVAVIDGSVVNVGDTLPDGARVGVIRSDRVALLERSGEWRVLRIASSPTNTPGRP